MINPDDIVIKVEPIVGGGRLVSAKMITRSIVHLAYERARDPEAIDIAKQVVRRNVLSMFYAELDRDLHELLGENLSPRASEKVLRIINRIPR